MENIEVEFFTNLQDFYLMKVGRLLKMRHDK